MLAKLPSAYVHPVAFSGAVTAKQRCSSLTPTCPHEFSAPPGHEGHPSPCQSSHHPCSRLLLFLCAVSAHGLALPSPAPGSSALQGTGASHGPCRNHPATQPEDTKDVMLIRDTTRALLLHIPEARKHHLHPGLQNGNFCDLGAQPRVRAERQCCPA